MYIDICLCIYIYISMYISIHVYVNAILFLLEHKPWLHGCESMCACVQTVVEGVPPMFAQVPFCCLVVPPAAPTCEWVPPMFHPNTCSIYIYIYICI